MRLDVPSTLFSPAPLSYIACDPAGARTYAQNGRNSDFVLLDSQSDELDSALFMSSCPRQTGEGQEGGDGCVKSEPPL